MQKDKMVEPLFRDSPPDPINVSKSKDSYLFDKKGKKYIDFIMGWCIGNAGWNKKQLMRAITSFKGPNYVTPTYQYERWEVLAKSLISLMPDKNFTCLRATGGTEAVELAMKTAKTYNKRKKFIAFKNAYHGQSLSCLALVRTHENKFGPYPDNYIRLEYTDWEETTMREY